MAAPNNAVSLVGYAESASRKRPFDSAKEKSSSWDTWPIFRAVNIASSRDAMAWTIAAGSQTTAKAAGTAVFAATVTDWDVEPVTAQFVATPVNCTVAAPTGTFVIVTLPLAGTVPLSEPIVTPYSVSSSAPVVTAVTVTDPVSAADSESGSVPPSPPHAQRTVRSSRLMRERTMMGPPRAGRIFRVFFRSNHTGGHLKRQSADDSSFCAIRR